VQREIVKELAVFPQSTPELGGSEPIFGILVVFAENPGGQGIEVGEHAVAIKKCSFHLPS